MTCEDDNGGDYHPDEKTVAAHTPVGPLLRRAVGLDALRATVEELLRPPRPG